MVILPEDNRTRIMQLVMLQEVHMYLCLLFSIWSLFRTELTNEKHRIWLSLLNNSNMIILAYGLMVPMVLVLKIPYIISRYAISTYIIYVLNEMSNFGQNWRF